MRMHSSVVKSRPLVWPLLSEFGAAIEYCSRVLEIEPDNAWARDSEEVSQIRGLIR